MSDETIQRILQRVATWPGVTVTASPDTRTARRTPASGNLGRDPTNDGPVSVSTDDGPVSVSTDDGSGSTLTNDGPVSSRERDDAEQSSDPPVDGTKILVGETVLAGLRDDGLLDLAVETRLRDHLLTEGRADRHPTVPTADRVSYRIAGPADVTGAMWLLKVAHLAQCARDGTLPATAVARRVRQLRLSPELVRLLHGDAVSSAGAADDRQSVPPRRSRD